MTFPQVLALDTTHEHGSLALARGLELLAELPLEAPGGFAHVLYPHLSEFLARSGVALESIDCFAAASGPGSFTGVRVGLACVKGLAEALGKPAIGVSNLQALAAFGHGDLRAPVIDARRGDVYGGLYDAEMRALAPEMVARLPVWLASLPSGVVFVSNFPPPLEDAVIAGPCLASAVARLAAARYLAGDRPDPAALDANYVRRSDAELFWKES